MNSVTIILWSFLAAMIVLAGAEWSARRRASVTGRLPLREQRRPIRNSLDKDALMRRVCAFADRADSVERRHPESRCKVPVGSAAGARLFECDAEFIRKCRAFRRGTRLRPCAPSAGGSSRLSLPACSEDRMASVLHSLFEQPRVRYRSARKSISARASAAMTLLRVPPVITPGFTVNPCRMPVKPAISSICRAIRQSRLRRNENRRRHATPFL